MNRYGFFEGEKKNNDYTRDISIERKKNGWDLQGYLSMNDQHISKMMMSFFLSHGDSDDIHRFFIHSVVSYQLSAPSLTDH